jgi:hypothetical protein
MRQRAYTAPPWSPSPEDSRGVLLTWLLNLVFIIVFIPPCTVDLPARNMRKSKKKPRIHSLPVTCLASVVIPHAGPHCPSLSPGRDAWEWRNKKLPSPIEVIVMMRRNAMMQTHNMDKDVWPSHGVKELKLRTRTYVDST